MTLDDTELKQRLDFAVDATCQAGELILDYYQTGDLHVELKSDASPVTVADRSAEQLIRRLIDEVFPRDGVLGEELDDKRSFSGFRWILDPIDGTKSFVSGVPLFGTLIGLEYKNRIVAGVCRLPALDEVVYAAAGQGTWWQQGDRQPQRTTVSSVSHLSDALLCYTSVQGFVTIDRMDVFETLGRSARLTRGWGDCYGHLLVATGRADVMVDPLLNPWDAAALIPLLQEAGGYFVAWNGEVTIHAGNGISVNSALRNDVLNLLNPGDANR